MTLAAPAPLPPRAVLRLAGVLTQLTGALGLLAGTIAVVLVQQNHAGGVPLVVLWVATAIAALAFGGFIYRGSLVAVIASAAIDACAGLTLLLIDEPQLQRLLRILPAGDVETVGMVLGGAAIGMIVAAGVCLLAIPQARRYTRWRRDATQLDAKPAAATAKGFVPPATPPGPGELALPAVAPGDRDRGTSIPGLASTAKAFPPPPVPVFEPEESVTMMVSPVAEARMRRRVYLALGGLAIGVGAGVGVLVSAHTKGSTADSRVSEVTGSSGTVQKPRPAVAGSAAARDAARMPGGSGSAAAARSPGSGAVAMVAGEGVADAGVADAGGAHPADASAGGGDAATVTTPAVDSVKALIAAEHDALIKGDLHALASLVAPAGFGFGVDADELGEGREAIEGQLRRDLGDVPIGGFTVTTRLQAFGELRGHAWIAQELEIAGAGVTTRRFAITQLAASIAGRWQVIAWEWGIPVPDATVERLAILGTLPAPKLVADRRDGSTELDAAVHAAFGSRSAFADARSERDDAFNFGSAPGEHVIGGTTIRRVFGKLRAQLRVHDGVRTADGSAWDPAQKTAPFIGWSAVNVDFTSKTRAATDVSQTFRVLAVWLREGTTWRIVQTQFSNGGPIR